MDVDGLAAVPLLRTLPRAPLEALAGQLPSRGVPAGQVVARAGDPATHLVIVERGSLSAARDTADGTRVQFGSVAGPCTLDKAATLDEAVHTATWTATTACQVRLLPVQLLRQLMGEHAALRDPRVPLPVR